LALDKETEFAFAPEGVVVEKTETGFFLALAAGVNDVGAHVRAAVF